MQDRELLFQMLASKDWDALSECLYSHKAVLATDPVIKQAISLFESEFIDHLRALSVSEQLPKLRHIALLIELNKSSFAEKFVNQLVDIKLRAMYETGDRALVGYASRYQDRPLACELLEQTRLQRPEHFAEAERPTVSVKAASEQQKNPAITSLFKSPQEQNFFLALREEFPQLLACPNLPVSAVLNFDIVRSRLDADARDYFFKAVFDCVVVDPRDNYRPLSFFELDSKYHDKPEIKKNDKLKNSICNAAGVKLTRIRAFEAAETKTDAFRILAKYLINTRIEV